MLIKYGFSHTSLKEPPDYSCQKISGQWTIGAVQTWWLEYEKLEARRRSFRPISAYFHAEDALKEKFPACLSPSEASIDVKGKALQ